MRVRIFGTSSGTIYVHAHSEKYRRILWTASADLAKVASTVRACLQLLIFYSKPFPPRGSKSKSPPTMARLHSFGICSHCEPSRMPLQSDFRRFLGSCQRSKAFPAVTRDAAALFYRCVFAAHTRKRVPSVGKFNANRWSYFRGVSMT